MKTTSFGISALAIVFFTILAVVQLCTVNTRTANLEDNLQHALESSLSTAMSDNSYTISTKDELVADVIEGIALYMDDLGPEDTLTLDVNEVDTDLGIVSVTATLKYVPVIGDKTTDTNGDGVVDDNDDSKFTTVTAEKTVIFDEYDVPQVGKYTTTYVVVDKDGNEAIYKSYTLSEGVKAMVPKDPYDGFSGTWYLGGSTPMTKDQIANTDLTSDMVFYSKAIH